MLEDSRADYEAFNVGTGEVMTVLDYVNLLVRAVNVEITPVILGAYTVCDVRHTV